MKSIVVAIDFSDAEGGVLQAASEMAMALGAELHLVHVVDSTPLYTMYGMHPEEIPSIVEYREVAQRQAEEKLGKLKGKLANEAVAIGCQVKVLDGVPMDELLEYASELKATMVVAGTHGHSAIGSVLLGSVASGLVRKAKLPVLIIPVGERD